MRLKSLMPLSGLTLLLCVATVRADLSFVLTPATQSGNWSTTVAFTGALTNTSPTTNLFLNNLHFSLTGTATNYLTVDTNAFFANVPGILSSNETYKDVIFAVALKSNTPPGDYSGVVTVQGGTNIFATTNLSSQTFHISLLATLGISRSLTNLFLSWSSSSPTGIVLQWNPNLSTTNWTTVTNQPAITNGLNQVTLSLPPTNQFYRLKYP